MAAHRHPPADAATGPEVDGDEGERPSEAELHEAGRAYRKDLARSDAGGFTPARDRDPMAVLELRQASLAPELLPLRHERMLRSPYDFYRGAEAVQAVDFAAEENTGRSVVVNGNPHLGNFGVFATRQRTTVMDMGDFEDAAYAPWEWDLKRLVASVVIAARERGQSDDRAETAALEAAASYRFGVREFLALAPLDRYWLRTDVRAAWPGKRPSSERTLAHALRAAGRRASRHEVHAITEHKHGRLTFIEDPPTFAHADDATTGRISAVVDAFIRDAAPEVALMLAGYRVSDIVRRVVGVGGIGVDRFLVALTGPAEEPIVLQVRAAGPGVLREFAGVQSRWYDTDAERAVAGQRVLQAQRDPFAAAVSHGGADYTVRQFRNGGIAFDLNEVDNRSFMDYADGCATILARAHAQSPNAPFIAGYLGASTAFDAAIASWALGYADQNLADFEAFGKAVKAGRFAASATERKRPEGRRKNR